MWWSQGDVGWGAWVLMSFGMFVFWAFVIWLFLDVVRTSATMRSQDRTPEEILAERLARGDIDGDEYRRHLETLRAPQTVGAGRKADR